MAEYGTKNPNADLAKWGITEGEHYWNLSSEELENETVKLGQGVIADNGALVVNTGEFTGRSPKDRFIVKDDVTTDAVDWNNINQPFPKDKFNQLKEKVAEYLNGKTIYIRDAYACAHPDYRLNIRLIAEYPWSNMFAYNMFMRPTAEEVTEMNPDWTILCAPGFHANPEVDGTRQHNFSLIDFEQKTILIGGSAYTGEIKKGIFSVLNFVLPTVHDVLSMHCSANVGKSGDTAVFFGLSGTGKTTLSADPERDLIGDDEHGWCDDAVFNFEGGCYAKTIDLSEEKEPQIWAAIKKGAILENIPLNESNTPDYTDASITQNTRVSYPIYHIDNAREPSKGGIPENIFFLTYDAFGVLPPISKLSEGQAMYHFISGYTSKVAGTEAGVTEPQTTFSACFGAPFMPLHPTRYADMLGERMKKHNTKVWLINTGMTGGAYGTGTRMSLKHTRAMITAALNGDLDGVEFTDHSVFGVGVPQTCPGVPDEILNPENTWDDSAAYQAKANKLADAFVKNFEQFADKASSEILAAAPKVSAAV